MTEMNAETTVKAKEVFERIAHSYGIHVKHYHCDNGLFDTKKFRTSIQIAKQTISFCEVNAHHQNGVAERHIRDLRDIARSMLLHAQHHWPKVITSNL